MTVYRVANLAYQMGGDRDLIQRLRDGLGFDEPCDVLALVEARDWHNDPVDVAAALGAGWDVAQDRSTGATAGSALAVRRTAARLGWTLSRLLSRRGRKVQDRYGRVGAVRPRGGKAVRTLVVHLPLESTGLQDDAFAEVRAWVDRQERRNRPWLVQGDFNMTHDQMRRRLGATRSYGKDVMGFVWSDRLGPVICSSSHYRGSDHAVLTLTTQETR